MVDPAKVMKDAALVLTGEIAGKIPGLAANGRKTPTRQIGVTIVAFGKLGARDG